MTATTHRPAQLPLVLGGRYAGMTFLAGFAAVRGDMAMIAAVFASFALMGFVDAAVYRRAGHAFGRHLGAGLAAGAVSAVALAGLLPG